MKALNVVLLALFILLPVHPATADTIIPGGSVSGVWNQAGSPYLIQDDIDVQAGENLFIEPGVEVIFEYHTKFYVFGSLRAQGTHQDSVSFSSYSLWYGIEIDNATDTCVFNYCTIEKVHQQLESADGGALDCQYSNLTVSHCSIRNNQAMWGAAIRCRYSEGSIEYSDFENNNGYEGSCLYIYGNSPDVRYCGFYNNTGSYG